jgi:hypothetical protein
VGEKVEEVFENIINLRINWPEDFDPVAKDLISKLLVIDPESRLGSQGLI